MLFKKAGKGRKRLHHVHSWQRVLADGQVVALAIGLDVVQLRAQVHRHRRQRLAVGEEDGKLAALVLRNQILYNTTNTL